MSRPSAIELEFALWVLNGREPDPGELDALNDATARQLVREADERRARQGREWFRVTVEEWAPDEFRGQREKVYRFLTGIMADHQARTWPRRWQTLRRKLRGSTTGFEWALREFYGVIHTAHYWQKGDEAETQRERQARKALPRRRGREDMARRWSPVAQAVARGADPREVQRLLNYRLGEHSFDDAEWGRLSALVTLGDLVPDPHDPKRSKLRPGSGRRRARETAQDELMRLLRGLGLSERGAQDLSREVLLWFLGLRVGKETIRKRRAYRAPQS